MIFTKFSNPNDVALTVLTFVLSTSEILYSSLPTDNVPVNVPVAPVIFDPDKSPLKWALPLPSMLKFSDFIVPASLPLNIILVPVSE